MHLIILDLNGCLAKKRASGKPSTLRPHVHEFLKELLAMQDLGFYRIAIWTSITEPNAQIIVNQLLTEEEQNKLLFIWCADMCKPIIGVPELAFKRYKDLEDAWRRYPEFNASNTTLFDDNDYKCPYQPGNLHLVKTFDPDDRYDTELLKILASLKKKEYANK